MAGPQGEQATHCPPSLHLPPDLSSSALSNPSHPSHSFPSLQKVCQLQSSGPDALFLESLQTLVHSPSTLDAGVADQCKGSPLSEPLGSISEVVEPVPLSDGSLASAPTVFHGSSRSPSGKLQSLPQPSWATIVLNSESLSWIASGPLEDENGKRLLAKGYNSAPSVGKPSGFQEEGIDAPGEIKGLRI
ncbi:hypothetical protein Nepgr_005386 [Nepenthes gracilis]|uniref:Uncharacterized protein n=1 Tax=Nepenthes gracilis TaxID=150966 RepID=A0AAD3S331_NEPGR|nr:hypothetical protein Nepgr_005386 [Nepenthes gracilis]